MGALLLTVRVLGLLFASGAFLLAVGKRTDKSKSEYMTPQSRSKKQFFLEILRVGKSSSSLVPSFRIFRKPTSDLLEGVI